MAARAAALLLAACGAALGHTPGDLPCCVGGEPPSHICDAPPICGCKRLDVVNASCWGFRDEDTTAALQAALDSGAQTVVVPSMGASRPWILRANGTAPPNKGAVQLRSNQRLILEQGVELQAMRNAFFGTGDCLIQANLVENLTIIGYGATLRMWREDYARPPYPKGEWRMGLSLRGVRNVGVFGLTIIGSGGDGLYLDASEQHKGEPTARFDCEDVVIRDVQSLANFRQGASIIGAVNVSVSHSVFADTAGTPPAAGVDLEPDSPEQRISGVSFTNCTFRNNSGAGVDVFLLAFANYTRSVDASFTDCVVDGAGGAGFRIAGVLPTGPRGNITVRGGSVRHTLGPGVALEAKAAARLTARFERVHFSDTASIRPTDSRWGPELAAMTPIWIDKLHKFNDFTGMTVGGVDFDGVTVSDERQRPFLRVTLNTSIDAGVSDVQGSVEVRSPFAAACDADFGSGSKQRTGVKCRRSARSPRPRRQRVLLGSWEYSGCGVKPCPGGTKLDIAPDPWTVEDYIVRTEGGARPWQTLIFTAGSNLTQAAQVHAKVHAETGESLPVLWEWNTWRTLPNAELALLDASLKNFSHIYDALVERFPQLPSSPFGIALGDEPPWELVHGRLAASAAAVKRRYPHAITHINLQFRTITNASVPPILGAATGLNWVGSDLYYSDDTVQPPVNASVAAFREIYNSVVYPHLRPDQKIVLVPFAHYCEFYCPIGALPLDHADAYTRGVAEQYIAWADSDDRIAALLIYSLKMVWVPEGADVCENPAYIVGSGNLTVTPWDTTWAGNGIGLTDKCVQDALVTPQPCPPPLPPAPLTHLRAEWVLGRGGTFVLAASPAGAPLCLGHFIPPAPCGNPSHRTYKVVNGTNVPTCDNFLGELQETSGLSVGACNSTRLVLQRQIWSCLDSNNCVGASRIQAAGNPGCERLPNFRAPPSGVPVACCLTYLPGDDGGGAFGLNQCGNMPGESGSFGEQHFQFVPVVGGGQDGPRRFTMQLAAPLPQGQQCVAALQPGYATPKTLQTYQNWSLKPSDRKRVQATPVAQPRQLPGLAFHPPVLVGTGAGFADNFHAVSRRVFIGSSGGGFLSTDSGAHWEQLHKTQAKGMKGVVADTFFRPNASAPAIRNLGYPLQGVKTCETACIGPATASSPLGGDGGAGDRAPHCFTCFQTESYASYRDDGEGSLQHTQVNETTSFFGLPASVLLRTSATDPDDSDFGYNGGSVANLRDGALVMTLDVRWSADRGTLPSAARAQDLTFATDLIAMTSQDRGTSWHYSATLCSAARHRGCGECCNENSITARADGTVLAVWRMGAGDGHKWNHSMSSTDGYQYYHFATSADGGASWTAEAPLPGLGCARPKLLSLPQTATVAAGAASSHGGLTVLGGGRLRISGTNDILLWSSSAGGIVGSWTEHSISYHHNALAAAAGVSKFTAEVNSTSEPRETSSYLSLLRAGVQGEFVVVYEKRGPPDLVFAMRVSSSSSSSSSYQNSSSKRQTTPVAPPRRRSLLQTAPEYTLRVESTDSTNMVVWQLEAFVDGGQNILHHCSMSRPWLSGAEQKKANCISDGRAYNSHMIPTLISDPVHWQNTSTVGQLRLPLVTDGIVYDEKLKAHEFDSQTGVSPTRGPELGSFLEFDLSRLNCTACRPTRVDLFTATGAGDSGWHTVSLLDAKRNVVALQTLRGGSGRSPLAGQSKYCTMHVKAPDPMGRPVYDKYIYNCSFSLEPYTGPPVKVPASAGNWQPLHTTPMPTTTAPAPADKAERLQRFAARDSASSVAALADEMFGAGGQLVRSSDTEAAFQAFESGHPQAALDAWQVVFFRQLAERDIHYAYNPILTACCSYEKAADDLLANFSVTFGAGGGGPDPMSVSLAKYEVGAIDWLHFADNLADVQSLAFVSKSWFSLLSAYNASSSDLYVKRWAQLIDDWTLNFFDDADEACHHGVNAKDMFVMLGANYWGTLLELLGDLEHNANISAVMPATTMARLMLKLSDEYLPAYWRVARGTFFNHDTSGMAANYIVARYIQQFRAGRTLMDEIRDHVMRWMAFGETKFGSMIEIGDEGHFAMPLDNLGVLLDQFDQDQPEWWTDHLRTWCHDVYRQMSQYYYRHTAPGGAFHRFSHGMPDPHRLFDFANATRMNPICDLGCGVINHTRKVVVNDTYADWVLDITAEVYGGGARPSVSDTPPRSLAAAQRMWDAAYVLLNTHPNYRSSALAEYRTDVMAYSGLFYVRSGWTGSQLLLHCIAPPGLGSVGFGMSLSPDPEKMGPAAFEVPGACQLSMSGGDRLTQAALFPLAALPALRVNGDSPLPTFSTHGLHPGSKTTALSYASQVPVSGRFFSDASFDLIETLYSGAWATPKSTYQPSEFRGLTGSLERILFPQAHSTGNHSRLWLHAVPYRALFAVDSFVSGDGPGKHLTLDTTLTLRVACPPGGKADPSRVTLDTAKQMVAADNSQQNQTSATALFASPGALNLSLAAPSAPTPEYASLFPTPTDIVDYELTVSRTSVSDEVPVLLSLVYPTDPGPPPPISSASVLADGSGIDATGHDGGTLCLRAARAEAVSCFGLSLPCDVLLAWCVPSAQQHGSSGGCAGRVEGMALSCRDGAAADFTFNHTAAAGFTNATIGRSLQMPTVLGPEPGVASSPVISEPAKVHFASPEATASTAEIRFTTDGTEPTREATLYTGEAVIIAESTLLKTKAFCKPGHCPGIAMRPAFASDGTTHSATAVAQFTLRPLIQPAADGRTVKAGLCLRSGRDPSWSKLYATAGSGSLSSGQAEVVPVPAFSSAQHCVNGSSLSFPSLTFTGYFNATRSGVYSLHAPKELQMPYAAEREAGYDLKLWVGDEEKPIPLWQRPHGIGAWHVPLAAGLHRWKMVYRDGRCWLASGALAPGAFYGLWRDYPQPWSTNPIKLPAQLSYTWPGRTGETAFTPELFVHSADEC